ncbi:MAG TPA: tetratricopeptide repeat protein [Actinomycetota bacterium]|nr:tetratricopeptide repeat protein [Actinomycetota bacterium]
MRCQRPGCTGQIEDGYCNTCGMAPEKAAAPSATPQPTRPASVPVRASASMSRGTRATTASGSTRRTGSGRTRRGNLGAGLVEVPPVPYKDPTTVVLANPEVEESKRYCGNCGKAVGRSKPGKAARAEGFCPHCGNPYSFAPKLKAGDLVAHQYEVAGCIAHGGLGWIYLAKDHNVSDRWVVLKGLLDAGDADAMEAAIAERRFLAEVEHPNIVKIYNFVEHGGLGYIVMEYIGGKSLKDVRKQYTDDTGEPVPVAQAIAYMLEILPALGYLHSKDLLFCDFKPENAIQTEEQMKLIDLGGVRGMDDTQSALYGTIGYQAPEVAGVGASIASDLFTVGRALAVLSFDFRGFQDPKRYATTLPRAEDVPVFGRYESFHRVLLKSTHPDPGQRFESADAMRDQLLGVLREVAALDGGTAQPAPSKLFSPELITNPDAPDWKSLPVPAVDPADPQAALLASLTGATPDQASAALERAPRSLEVGFRLAQAYVLGGDFDEVDHTLDRMTQLDPADWRIHWWRGIRALASGYNQAAVNEFDAVYGDLPGEPAPKLALACALEMNGDPQRAGGFYARVAVGDPTSASAAFGLARCRMRTGDRAGAAKALAGVPATSSAHARAQVTLCRVLSTDVNGTKPSLQDLVAASQTIEQLQVDAEVRYGLTREILTSALAMVTGGSVPPDGSVRIGGAALDERDIRRGLERACRELARYAPTRAEKIALIDKANEYRPLTLT